MSTAEDRLPAETTRHGVPIVYTGEQAYRLLAKLEDAGYELTAVEEGSEAGKATLLFRTRDDSPIERYDLRRVERGGVDNR